MASVGLDFIPYQPPPSTARPVKWRSAVAKSGLSTASSERNDPVDLTPQTTASAKLAIYDFIEYVDLTTSLPVKAMDPLGFSALGFGGADVLEAQGKVRYP